MGARADALAALRRSLAVEPDNWRHHVRLASTAWGGERLRAARGTLALFPGCPLAHWLAATVNVARGALVAAEQDVDRGVAAAREDAPGHSSAVALWWLKGLLCLARGASAKAVAAPEAWAEVLTRLRARAG